MSTIQNWLIGKGLTLAESSVRSLLDIKDTQTVLSKQMEGALGKLDQLLDAPYEVARRHAREGEVKEAIDHLKDAIALRPLHLPARLLHIQLLCLEKKYEAALDNYWDLLLAFSYREDIVPPLLYQAFIERLYRAPVRLPSAPPLRLERRFTEGWPSTVWCSPTAVAVEWLTHSKFLFFKWDERAVTLHSWEGRPLHESAASSEMAMAMLTSEYAVYRQKQGSYRVLRLADGTEVEGSPIDEETFRAIFLPPNREVEDMPLYRLTIFTRDQLSSGASEFSNVVLRLGSREVEEEQYVPGYFDTATSGGVEIVTVHIPYVECLARPLPLPIPAAELPKPELVEEPTLSL